MKKIYVDMDGTIANLYGVDDWLKDLVNENVRPYAIANPLYKSEELRKAFGRLIDMGFELIILSWLSKSGSDDYNRKVKVAKLKWLEENNLDDLFIKKIIVPYGTSKQEIVGNNYLVDDEDKNLVGLENGLKTKGDDLLDILNNIK